MTTLEDMDAVLDQKLVVCVGPGGVGKTTLAAALALRSARLGHRALVLTIDPAKRLADALGLDGLDDSIRTVDVGEGRLGAAMLDTKSSYDALIGRIVAAENVASVLDNDVYRAFSRTLARSHAYIAAERLYDVMASGEWDRIVLDTPPTRSALEILDAPGRLAQFLDDRVLRFFLRRSEGGGTFTNLASLGGEAALKLLSKLAGETIVRQLVEFLQLLADQRDGFRERAGVTWKQLHDPSTGYVLVASASSTSLADAEYLAGELRSREIQPKAVIFNLAYVPEPFVGGPLRREPSSSDPALKALRTRLCERQDSTFEQARAFSRKVAPGAASFAIAAQEEGPTSIGELEALLEAPTSLLASP